MIGGENIISVAIEKRRVAGKSVVLFAIHSSELGEKQKVLESLRQRFELISYKKGLYIIENADSVVPVKRFVEENFPSVRLVSMVEIEILGGY